ncbi:MAG: hypothetical protein JO209_06140 [Acidisphaera sp.]|nr:hypothetical protein [Acidisphaera sp.]
MGGEPLPLWLVVPLPELLAAALVALETALSSEARPAGRPGASGAANGFELLDEEELPDPELAVALELGAVLAVDGEAAGALLAAPLPAELPLLAAGAPVLLEFVPLELVPLPDDPEPVSALPLEVGVLVVSLPVELDPKPPSVGAVGATRKGRELSGLLEEDVLLPEVPAPEVPVPEVPAPEVPEPEAPAPVPDVSLPELAAGVLVGVVDVDPVGRVGTVGTENVKDMVAATSSLAALGEGRDAGARRCLGGHQTPV